MNKLKSKVKASVKELMNRKNAERAFLFIVLMIVFSSDVMAQTTNTQVTALRKILVPAVSVVFGLLVLFAGFKAATKFINHEPKEGMAYIGGIVAAILIWTLCVQNASGLAALLPQT